MSDTRNITRNTDRRPGGEDDPLTPGTSTLGTDVRRWGQILHGHAEASARSGRDAEAEVGLRRNRSGQ